MTSASLLLSGRASGIPKLQGLGHTWDLIRFGTCTAYEISALFVEICGLSMLRS